MKALLLVRGDQRENAYGPYTGEILRAEGFNWYQVEQFDAQDADYLSTFGLVLLTRCFLTQPQIQELVTYVERGGRLLCFRPPLRLAQALGLQPTYKAHKGGYLRIDGRHPVGQGLCQEAIQIHGMAEEWELPDGSALRTAAWLGADRTGPLERRGLIVGSLGAGAVAILAYDLPATVASIRQGDPMRANTLSAGLDGIYRPSELFVDHLDAACALLPQADVHSALLASVIEWLVGHPVPRLWYYPRPAQRSVVIMTSDDDWSKIEEFEQLIGAVEQRDGRITFYLVPGTHVTEELAERWGARGHVFSVHPDLQALPEDVRQGFQPGWMKTPGSLDEQYALEEPMLTASVKNHEQRFAVKVRTVRHHAARWRGYVEAARILEGLGVQMDFNYVSIWPFSATYMIGSGRPMKFVEEDGQIIEVFQQSTLYSEDVILAPFVFSLKWSTEHTLSHVEHMLTRNLEETYTPIGLNSHPVSFASYSSQFVEGFLDMATGRGVPIVTGEAWLDLTLARYEMEFESITWQNSTLRFTLRAGARTGETTVMVPLGQHKIGRVTVDGTESDVTMARLWGREYALLHLAQPQPAYHVQVDYIP